ncbi:hypothetical protein [Tetragenococcus solitarius]|uniref:Rgg family transcriptional regulator n=1 Tax=Tetragenococcus solitarius TaxID=71453 RepID=UPI0031D62240
MKNEPYLKIIFKKLKIGLFFELYLFGHAIQFLDKTFMANLFKELQKKQILYDTFRNDNFSMLFYIYNNIILFLLDEYYLDEAKQLINQLESYFNDRDKDYYHRARIFNLKGLFLYLSGEKEEGLVLIKKANLMAFLTKQNSNFLMNEKNYLSKYLTPQELNFSFDFHSIDDSLFSFSL